VVIDGGAAVGEYRAVDVINADLGRRLVGTLRPTRPRRSGAATSWAPELPPGRMLQLPFTIADCAEDVLAVLD
jgi:hypothetical protein